MYFRVPEGGDADLVEEVEGSGARIVFLGEVHERPWIVSEVVRLIRHTCSRGWLGFLAVEYFNVEQQSIVDDWASGVISWDRLVEEYRKGPEGFNLEVYRPMLEAAANCGARIVGVMPPRTLATRVAREGVIPGRPDGAPAPAPFTVYPPYRSLLLTLFPREGPMARIPVERLLLAQSYKDSVAAWSVARASSSGPGIVVMGWAHVEPRGGVATRVRILTGLDGLVVGFREAGVEETLAWYRSWAGSLETRLVGVSPAL